VTHLLPTVKGHPWLERCVSALLLIALAGLLLWTQTQPSSAAGEARDSLQINYENIALFEDGQLNEIFWQQSDLHQSSKEAPEGFAQECFDAQVLGAAEINYFEGVLGFNSSASPAECLAQIQEQLLQRGWCVQDAAASTSDLSDGTVSAQFSKAEGEYRWLCVFAQSVLDQTAVVVWMQKGFDDEV